MSVDWRGTLWTLLVNFCKVIIRRTDTFWSPCTLTSSAIRYPGKKRSTAFSKRYQKDKRAKPACPSGNSSIKTKMSTGRWYNDTESRKIEPLVRKPDRKPLCSPSVSQRPDRDLIRASEVRDMWLIACAMAPRLMIQLTLSTALPLYRTGISLLSRERFLYI